MGIETAIAELDSFTPTDETDNESGLYDILGPLAALAPELRAPVIPAMLGLIERYPDAEFGSPGPLVHEIEAIPGYQGFLRESVLRQPADLSVWMVNRILNSDISTDASQDWMDVLRTVSTHPLAPSELQAAAREFLADQSQ